MSVTLSVDDPVLPGQPLAISWRMWSLNFALDLKTVSAKVFLGDRLIYTAPNDVSYSVTQKSGDSGLVSDTIQPPQDFSLAQFLYTIGAKTLRLEVTAHEGSAKGVYTTETDFTVMPEPVDATWWQWTSFASGIQNNVRWKTDFFPTGNLINQSKWTYQKRAWSCSADLAETDIQANTTFSPLKAQIDSVPNAPTEIKFGMLDKNWQWAIDGVFLIPGPLRQDFDYAVKFTLTDLFGNKYPTITSSSARVRVSVPDYKFVAAVWGVHEFTAATYFAASALATAGFPPVAAVFAALAAAATLHAAIAWAIAKDPPAPDPNFRDRVRVVPGVLPEALQADTRFAQLIPVLEMKARILAQDNALTEIEGRILGARQARDTAALAMQKAAYQDILNRMMEDAQRLPNALDAAEEAIKLIESLGAVNATKVWREGLSAEGRRGLEEAGLTDETVTQFEHAIRNPFFASQVADGITRALWRTAVDVHSFATGRQRQASGATL